LLRQVEEKLESQGMRSVEAKAFVKPVKSLLTDNLFWRQQSDGLALFIQSNMYLYYRVPILLKEQVGVGERFYINPLVKMFSDCGYFYVLAISQNDIRLLQCTASGSVRLDVSNLPKNKEEALYYETPDNRMRYRVSAPAGGSNLGVTTAIQTRVGSRPDYAKRNMMQYFQQVSSGIHEKLRDEKMPLVMAAVDYLHPMYREANLYHNLLPDGVIGNPELLGDDELREQAWNIVRLYFEKARNNVIAEFRKSAGTGLTAIGLSEVIPAAYHGRVRFLLTAEDVQQWGVFNPDTDTVKVHSKPEQDDEDLMDLAAYQTLSHSGTIHTLNPNEVPGGAPVSAILRF
ncbi:MAG: hypothetical protein PHU23_07290, partial [Dehalococcoidales bacterium]|nr:hypothetical protein [Dehalococcoidales bacterium]